MYSQSPEKTTYSRLWNHSMGGHSRPYYYFLIETLKVWSITYKLYTAQAKNFIPVLSGHPLERTHNLHTDQGETPTLTSLLLKRKVAMNSYCSRALTSLSPYENRMTTVSLFAFNTCVLRYLAAGFYSASKTAHLVQGTQVSSDAGHNNVHWCATPTAVNKQRDEVTNSRGCKTKDNGYERAVTWRSDWKSDQSRHAWSCWSRLQWQPPEL